MATTSTSTPTTPTIRGLPRPLARAMEAYADRLDVDAIRDAYELAAEAHAGQTRASGQEYVTHTIEVATILAKLRLDTASIIVGLIHDVVEDTELSLTDLEQRFGSEVATIVDGVTKLGQVRFRSATEQQVENYRKMLLSMAEDARVILVKLADRVHNMRTLEHLSEHKRRRIARETREIYAPLAHRLGMAAIRWELEDLAFKSLEPDAYAALTKKIKQRRKEREREVLDMQRPIKQALEEADIPAEVSGRPKHLWSIHRKIMLQGRTLRGYLRPDGNAGSHRFGTELLRRTRYHPQQVDADPGAFPRLHRDPQVEHVSVAAYDRLRSGRASVRDPDPH